MAAYDPEEGEIHMKSIKIDTRHLRRLAAIISVVCLLPGMTACATVWDWMWARDENIPVDTNSLILGGKDDTGESDVVFEGAVEFREDSTYRGTDIYYIGTPGNENRSRIVVIDAGHQEIGSQTPEPNGPGATDTKAEVTTGATGVVTGQNEYELNLRVALLLRNELIRRGYSVVMIRETNNVSVSNKERAEIANKYNAYGTATYVRIHANGWTDAEMRGAMTICQSADNPYPTCAAYYRESYLLSSVVLNAFCEETGMEKLSVREMDDMTGTNWSQVPTTILEMGFLTNETDDRHMNTEFFRQLAAYGIADGLDAYYATAETWVPETEAETDAATVAADILTETAPASDGVSDTVPSLESPVDTTGMSESEIIPETIPETALETVPEAVIESETEAENIPPTDPETVGDVLPETQPIADSAVDFDENVTHAGTDIYYRGTPGSENRNCIVIIDAGHQLVGSRETEPVGPGATQNKAEVSSGTTGSTTGQHEYELNLRVALALRNELIGRGYSVVMIRETNEVSVSNMERAEIANKYSEYGEVAYVRIHANGFDDPTVQGALTICQSAANPYPTCASHYADSRQLSELVLDAFCRETEMKKRPIQENDGMTGTNWSRVPTTIVEMGFLTNEADDRLMASEPFQYLAASGIANGLDAYFAAISST